ncbi:MAG: hypothetical protein GY865_15385, partial [candidate division Zixibacteria bacterium]|nr:hypothetical protein [candidate division Zixibacteria bacterium]
KVGDTMTNNCPDPPDVIIPIYLNNFADTVAGFSFRLQLNRPGIMEFQTSLDIIEYETYYIYTEWDDSEPPIPTDSVIASPTWVCLDGDFPFCADSTQLLGYYDCTAYSENDCIDSVFVEWTEGIDPSYIESVESMVGVFDTVGTLTSGWEMITTRSLSETGLDMLITAYADQNSPPPDTRTPGIGPQYDNTPLIKILCNAFPIDDDATERTVKITIDHTSLNISNELGASLCVNSEQLEKVSYFMCVTWLIPDEDCLFWNQVQEYECPPEGCDSIKVDTLLSGFLEIDRCCDPTGEYCLTEIEGWQCPNQFEGLGVWHSGCINIVDGSFYVEQCKCGTICGDFNNDGTFNILDVVFLINYIYKGGPPPTPSCIVMDVSKDGIVDIRDVICLIDYRFKFGNCCDDFPWF